MKDSRRPAEQTYRRGRCGEGDYGFGKALTVVGTVRDSWVGWGAQAERGAIRMRPPYCC